VGVASVAKVDKRDRLETRTVECCENTGRRGGGKEGLQGETKKKKSGDLSGRGTSEINIPLPDLMF